MQELNEFDIISKVEINRLLQEFEEQNMNLSEHDDIEYNEMDEIEI